MCLWFLWNQHLEAEAPRLYLQAVLAMSSYYLQKFDQAGFLDIKVNDQYRRR
jgi:hypothetical protein